MDQLVGYYSFIHKSVKWWRKVFFWVLEVTVVNSYIIYKQTCSSRRPLSHLAYRRKLIDILSAPLRSSATPRTNSRASLTSVERLQPVRHFQLKGSKRRDCIVCSDRKPGGTRHLTLYECSTCPNSPAICPTECFKTYHTKKNFRQ